MNKKIGFIGCGNMGHAILKGIIDSGLCNVSDVFVSARTKETLEKIRNELAVNVCSNIEVAQKSDILFIAVISFGAPSSWHFLCAYLLPIRTYFSVFIFKSLLQ